MGRILRADQPFFKCQLSCPIVPARGQYTVLIYHSCNACPKMVRGMNDSPTITPLLETRNISKAFGDVVANRSVDFQVGTSQIHALLGENGAGKSTLMKIICGLQQPDSGEILWKGERRRIENPKAARAIGIGMVHQHFALFEGLSVTENVAFSIDGAVPGKALERRIMELAERYRLDVEPARSVFELSAGEKQRIEILRALLLNPELLILDEPTSVLTPQEASQLFDTIRTLADNGHGAISVPTNNCVTLASNAYTSQTLS